MEKREKLTYLAGGKQLSSGIGEHAKCGGISESNEHPLELTSSTKNASPESPSFM